MASKTTKQTCNVVGVFERPEVAERVRDELIRSGVYPNQIHTRFSDSIRGWFGPADASSIESGERAGRGLVVAEGPDDEAWVEKTAQVMRRYSPIESGEPASGARTPRKTGAGKTGESSAAGRTEGEKRMPAVEVGKRRVIAGGVWVFSRVIEVPVEKEVELKEERGRAEHRPAGAPASPKTFREEDIEAAETREEPVSSKEARVTGEAVRKEGEKRRDTARGTVRRQDVEKERMEGQEPPSKGQPPE